MTDFKNKFPSSSFSEWKEKIQADFQKQNINPPIYHKENSPQKIH